jgi:hypothetical protein
MALLFDGVTVFNTATVSLAVRSFSDLAYAFATFANACGAERCSPLPSEKGC